MGKTYFEKPKDTKGMIEIWAFTIFPKKKGLLTGKAEAELLKKQEGILGFHHDAIAVSAVFNTENNAKRAWNTLKAEGIVVGQEIAQGWVEEKWAKIK